MTVIKKENSSEYEDLICKCGSKNVTHYRKRTNNYFTTYKRCHNCGRWWDYSSIKIEDN